MGMVLIALLFFMGSAELHSAQETLGLREVIGRSLVNNSVLKMAREKERESRLKMRETWGKLWPELSSDFTYTRYGAEEGVSSLTDGVYDARFVKGTIAVNPGTLYHTLKENHELHVIAVNEVRRVEVDAITQTIKLYYQMLLAQEMITLRTDSVRVMDENLRVVTAGYKNGTFTRLDFLRAKVSTANERTRLIIAENDFQNARAALNIQLDREPDTLLGLDTAAIYRGTEEESAYAGLSERERRDRIAAMVSEALKRRPEFIQLRLKKQAQLHAAGADAAVYLWPTLYVTGSYGATNLIFNDKSRREPTGNPTVDQIMGGLFKTLSPEGWNLDWRVSLGATWRWGALLPSDPSHARKNENESRARQTDFQMEDLVKKMRLEIQQGFLKLVSSAHAILSQKGNIESAEESRRVAAIQFRSGMIDNTRFLDADVGLETARTLYVNALYDFQAAKAELNRAIGYEYFVF